MFLNPANQGRETALAAGRKAAAALENALGMQIWFS